MKDKIEYYSKLMPVEGCFSTTEAERRASEFLSALAFLADARHVLTKEKIKALSVQNATYSQELSKGTAKTITENKTTVEASGVYIAAREDLENIDNDISYIKAYQEIFNNCHLFYRMLAKQDGPI